MFDPGTWLGEFVLSRLVATPRGRAFLFDFMANAEESDEGAFDHLVARVDAADVQKMVRTHQDDEQRHARLLRECLARTGLTPGPLPAHLRYIDRLDRATGGAFRTGFPDDDARTGVIKCTCCSRSSRSAASHSSRTWRARCARTIRAARR